MMELVSSGVVFLFVSVFLMWVHVGLSEGENGHGGIRNYISWEDLEVDEQRLTLKRHDDVRVIIVNKYGWGHSETVQGAVDMVPVNNKHRVKIYIYPGIYRYCSFVIFKVRFHHQCIIIIQL